jgi:hypothetical protein
MVVEINVRAKARTLQVIETPRNVLVHGEDGHRFGWFFDVQLAVANL